MNETARYVSDVVHDTPAIDVHSHQGTRGIWQARNLWDILSYHWLAADLRCAGCPAEIFTSREMDPREKVKRTVPYSASCRNTVNHWCFINICRDLYGFQGRYLDAGNWEELYEAVAEKADDPEWERQVLSRAGVKRVSAAQNEDPPRFPEHYFMYDSAEYLFCPGVHGDTHSCLRRMGGAITDAESLRESIHRNVRSLLADRNVRALHVWAPLTWTYTAADPGQATLLLHKAQASARMTQQELDELASYTADCTAEVCGELGIVIQLFFGSVQMEESGPYVSMYRPEWLRALVPFLSRHPQTNIDLFMATRPVSHEAAVLARNYPNLWLSGAWWQGFTPTTLSTFFRDRLEMLPMNKWNAFFSDAYCVEWIHGKVTLTRNRLAAALSGVLEEGLLDRDSVPDVVRAVMHGNAVRLYGLGG